MLAVQPALKSNLNDPLFAFGQPAIACAASHGNRAVIDVLLDSGADVNARSNWWAGSFGALDSADEATSAYLIERGARLDGHAAARLGWLDKLKELIAADPAVVHARGGDGQTPLHFASTPEIAAYLLDHGANIDARDIDHESTPAQYLVASHPDVVRYLIGRGAKTDLLLACAIGDIDLARRHLDENPDSIRVRVNETFFPKQDPRAGGSIYIWTIGINLSPRGVARKFGHPHVLALLLERSPADVRLIDACVEGDRATAQALAGTPLDDAARGEISTAAQNNNVDAVKLMLELGWPVAGDGRTTPLHWAAWHGNAEMVREILRHSPPLEQRDPEFNATPLGWAIHGSQHSWHCRTGNYAAVVEALLQAGVAVPDEIDGGTEAVRQALTAGRPPRTP